MKDNYNFSRGIKNPYAKKLKKQITFRIDADAIEYFNEQTADVEISYQNLINLYLKDCTEKKRSMSFSWE